MYILPWNTNTTLYCVGIHWHSAFPFPCSYPKDIYLIISGKISLHKELPLNLFLFQSLNAGHRRTYVLSLQVIYIYSL